MKRSPLRRKTPLRNRTRINPLNEERRAQRRAEEFGPQAELCRGLPCCVCFAPPPSDPAHVRTRAAGGRDDANVVPLCRAHHTEQHTVGIKTFQVSHGVDLLALAEQIAGRVRAAGSPRPSSPRES